MQHSSTNSWWPNIQLKDILSYTCIVHVISSTGNVLFFLNNPHSAPLEDQYIFTCRLSVVFRGIVCFILLTLTHFRPTIKKNSAVT